jgi:GcrA cell cycle regulator
MSDFHFCGKSKVTGLPYCEFHARRAFQPAMPRRRERGDVEAPLPITAQVPTKESA